MGGDGAPGAPRGGAGTGIFGGTFDPFHYGHLVVAQDVLEALELDRILFMPVGDPPHKGRNGGEGASHRAPPELRFRMVSASVAGDPRFHVSDLELRRPGPSYTVDTLRELTRPSGSEPAEVGGGFTLLMGADQWASFHRWKEPAEILRLARVAVMTREGDGISDVSPELEHGLATETASSGGKPLGVPVTRIDLSSTGIRERWAQRRSIRYLVPEPVRRIIETESLYR